MMVGVNPAMRKDPKFRVQELWNTPQLDCHPCSLRSSDVCTLKLDAQCHVSVQA